MSLFNRHCFHILKWINVSFFIQQTLFSLTIFMNKCKNTTTEIILKIIKVALGGSDSNCFCKGVGCYSEWTGKHRSYNERYSSARKEYTYTFWSKSTRHQDRTIEYPMSLSLHVKENLHQYIMINGLLWVVVGIIFKQPFSHSSVADHNSQISHTYWCVYSYNLFLVYLKYYLP